MRAQRIAFRSALRPAQPRDDRDEQRELTGTERVEDLARARGNKLITVGEHGTTLRLVSRDPTLLGQQLVIEADGKAHKVNLPLIGSYQVANALTAAGRRALERYLDHMEALLRATRGGD